MKYLILINSLNIVYNFLIFQKVTNLGTIKICENMICNKYKYALCKNQIHL